MSTILALVLSASPALADAPEPDPSWSRIVNGEDITDDRFPSAVAIGFEAGQGFRQSTCSASLITSRILLTAGHCTEEYVKYGVDEDLIVEFGAAFFGNVVNSAETKSVGFSAFRNHPGYGTGPRGEPLNDIGVIVLEDDAPVRPTWFQAEPLPEQDVVGKPVVSVGYGITSGSSQNSSGIKRFARLRVSRIDGDYLVAVANQNPSNANVCSGDSGGPQYRRTTDGDWVQWGVHSYVFTDFTNFNQDPCLSASGSTDVSAFGDWVLRQIQREHGTTDRCEVMAAYGDFVCDLDCTEPDPDCDLDENGDGIVDEVEIDAADGDGDGILSIEELYAGPPSERVAGCNTTGTAPAWMGVLGLLALGLGRRRDA